MYLVLLFTNGKQTGAQICYTKFDATDLKRLWELYGEEFSATIEDAATDETSLYQLPKLYRNTFRTAR